MAEYWDWTELTCLVTVTSIAMLATTFLLWKLGIICKSERTNVEAEKRGSKEMQGVLHLNTLESIREFLLSSDQDFKRVTLHGKVITEMELDIWQEENIPLLKHYLQDLTSKRRNHFETALTESTRDLVGQMQRARFDPKEFTDLLKTSIVSLACRIAFGNSDDIEPALKSKVLSLIDNWPDCSYLVASSLQRSPVKYDGEFVAAKENMHKLLKEIIAVKKKEWSGYDQDCYINHYFATNSSSEDTDYDELSYHVIGFLLCSSGSLIKYLLSALAFLTDYADVQERIQDEIKNVSPEENLIRLWLDQRKRVVFFEAFLYEVLRLASIVPCVMMHRNRNTDDAIEEVVALNFGSLLQEQREWQNPSEFMPSRFLDDGQIVTPDAFVPFSFGKTCCPGQDYALMSCFVILSSVLRKFRLRKAEDSALDSEGNRTTEKSFYIAEASSVNNSLRD